MLLINCTIAFDYFRRKLKQEETDELSDDSQSSSESSLEPEAKGLWRASEPPEESFSDVDEGQEWRYQIVGEEVDGSGKIWCISSIPPLFSVSFLMSNP